MVRLGMPRNTRVSISLDGDAGDRFASDARAIGSTPAALGQLLIRWYLGDAADPPARPTTRPARTAHQAVNTTLENHSA